MFQELRSSKSATFVAGINDTVTHLDAFTIMKRNLIFFKSLSSKLSSDLVPLIVLVPSACSIKKSLTPENEYEGYGMTDLKGWRVSMLSD